MQSINLSGGIGETLKSKVFKNKSKGKKICSRRPSAQSPIMTKKSISIKSRNICKDSLGSLTSNIGTYTDRNEYVQKKKKSFMKKIDMSQKSQIQDSSRSYNQCTKEDTNSSCNITENSNS